MIKRLALAYLFFPLLGSSQLSLFQETWRNDKDLKHAAIGYCVMNAADSKLIAEYTSGQLLVPASTLKVVSTAAALRILGPAYRYETRIYYTGDYNKTTGILNGDLIIEGSGDPTLESGYFAKAGERVTDKWAKILKEKGLKEIKGSIIGDASFFDRRVPSHWIWEDISNYFGAVPCGLTYRDNKFSVQFITGEKGSEAKIAGYAPAYLTQSITLTSDVIATGTEDQAYAYGDPFSYTREIHGSLPPNKTSYEIEVALPDPALLCAEDLYRSLSQAGINCQNTRTGSTYKKSEQAKQRQLVYTHYSPTLDKIVYFTNLKSDNLYCESLLKTLGKGKSEEGLHQVKLHWQKRGLDTSEIYMEDASGLGRINAITPHFQAGLLCKVFRDSTIYNYFNSSLPAAGRQGSMSNIGKGKWIESNMRAKTGYITRARAYCGYVKTRSGKELAFSFIFNNYNCSAREAKLKMEKFLISLGEL